MKDFWKIAEDTAEEYGNTMNREDWRLVIIAFLAETRKEALEQAPRRSGPLPARILRANPSEPTPPTAPRTRLLTSW